MVLMCAVTSTVLLGAVTSVAYVLAVASVTYMLAVTSMAFMWPVRGVPVAGTPWALQGSGPCSITNHPFHLVEAKNDRRDGREVKNP